MAPGSIHGEYKKKQGQPVIRSEVIDKQGNRQKEKTIRQSNKQNYYTVCPGRSDPFYVVTYYIKRVELLPGHIVHKNLRKPGKNICHKLRQIFCIL